MTRDPYLVLGVPPIAKPEEIRKAYRDLSRTYHPDLNPDMAVGAAEKMKDITAAHDIVSNKQKREDYDNQPHFKVRTPRDFARKAATAVFGRKAPETKPGLKEKLLGFMFKQPEAPKRDRDRAMTHFTMGMTMTEKIEFYSQALEEFTAALRHDPEFAEAAYNLGLMAYKTGRFGEARQGFQRALAVNRDDRQARLMLDILRIDDM